MHQYIKPGFLEIYTGPMGSFKSGRIIDRLDGLIVGNKGNFIAFKPEKETRDPGVIKSRIMRKEIPCGAFKKSEEILDNVKYEHKVVLIDEANLADENLSAVVKQLLLKQKNVIVGGLNLNFRGEPIPTIAQLLPIADYVNIRPAVCYCGSPANRTQLLLNGKPAPYSTPDDIVGDIDTGLYKDQTIKYEPRCLEHHVVPK